jgi:hypothetical protein
MGRRDKLQDGPFIPILQHCSTVNYIRRSFDEHRTGNLDFLVGYSVEKGPAFTPRPMRLDSAALWADIYI